jgi:isochorismate hydrolase
MIEDNAEFFISVTETEKAGIETIIASANKTKNISIKKGGIPTPELLAAIEKSDEDRNLYGPFDNATEAVTSMLDD